MEAGWISVEEAAGMLCGTVDDVRRLSLMRRLQWREASNTVLLEDVITVLELREFDAVLDTGRNEREARKRAEAVRAKWEGSPSENTAQQSKPPIENWKSKIGNCKLIDGRKVISRKDAAAMLGIGPDYVSHLCSKGRLNNERRGRQSWVWLEDVEDYRRLQKVWESKGGYWTPYGRLDKGESILGPVPVPGRNRPPAAPKSAAPRPGAHAPESDKWIRIQQAADILAVSRTRI